VRCGISNQVYSSLSVYKSIDSLDSGFFFDYNNNRKTLAVDVLGDFQDLLEVTHVESRNKVSVDTSSIETTQDLYEIVLSWSQLWLRPFIICKVYPNYAKFFNRGVEYRSWRLKIRFNEIINKIPRDWIKVRPLKSNPKLGKSNHIVVTITIPHNIPINKAFKLIIKRREEVLRYFRKYYRVKGYVGVYEIHENGYPHIHLIIFLDNWLTVFKYKGIWRFSVKRIWDKDLSTDTKGFIDCFGLRNKSKAIKYFSKYLSKFIDVNAISSNSSDINLKPYSLFVFRIFRVRPIIMSKNLMFRKFIKIRPGLNQVRRDILKLVKLYRSNISRFMYEISKVTYKYDLRIIRKSDKLRDKLVEIARIYNSKTFNLEDMINKQKMLKERLDNIISQFSYYKGDDELDPIVNYFVVTKNYEALVRVALYVYEKSVVGVFFGKVIIQVSVD